MAARIDVKNILSIFNESRLQADQNVQRERLAEMNRLLEERKMAEEADYRNKSIGVQQAEQEANARFREASTALGRQQLDETIRNNTLQHQAAMANSPVRMQAMMAKLNADMAEKAREREFKLGSQALTAQQTFQSGAPTFDATSYASGALSSNALYDTDASQTANADLIRRQVDGINKYLDYVEKRRGDPQFAKAGVNINAVALQRYNDIDALVNSYVGMDGNRGGDWWDRVGDNDSVLGMFGGASDENKQRYELLNSLNAIKQRLKSNPLHGVPVRGK